LLGRARARPRARARKNQIGVCPNSNNELTLLMDAMASTGIQEIDLSGNFLGFLKPEEFKNVFKLLSTSTIQCIHLDNNQFDRMAGARLVADLLSSLFGEKEIFHNTTDPYINEVRHSISMFIKEVLSYLLNISIFTPHTLGSVDISPAR